MICFRDERTNLMAMARLSLVEEAMLFVIGKPIWHRGTLDMFAGSPPFRN
jgi:hypothetical protein